MSTSPCQIPMLWDTNEPFMKFTMWQTQQLGAQCLITMGNIKFMKLI